MNAKFLDFLARVAKYAAWILVAGNGFLLIIGSVAVLAADVFFSASVLGIAFGSSVGYLMSFASSGLIIASQVMVGFGDDRDLATSWNSAGKIAKGAFIASFLVRAGDAYLATIYVDQSMLTGFAGEDQVYWISKAGIFVIDFLGEMIAPAILLLLASRLER